jgi:subtilase family serine protease
VQGVRNLDDFRPKSMMKPSTNRATSNSAKAQFTSGVSGSNFLAPGDITTIYDVKAMYNAGYTGTGETIAIMGQSAIVTSDIEAFQNAASLTVKDPNQLLVPGTGGSEVISGDEGESDLDIEWAGAIAPGAEILFVYTGSSSSNGVFDALQYAVDEELAPILSLSYGACENDLGSSNIATLELITSQAAAQGQTIVAASGDSGSTGCYNSSSTDTLAQQEVLNVNYPASSPYVTGIGGTEFSEGSNTSTYWSSNGTNDVVTSALSYIPEVVWNDDSAQYGISATGGGVSTIFSKPSWQTGVTGIPADGKRDVPDISLDASNDHDSYLYCTSDTSGWSTSQVASCNSGFRDASTSDLTAAGGTSFATPIVAAMVALINQKENYTAGQGLLNPTLYTLAANSSTYASVFHDITSGTNKCTAGSTYCSGTIGYSATTGYDLTTGLGSFDMTALAGAWPASTSTLIGTTTTVSASNSSPTVGTNVTFAIAVGSDSGSTVPTGSVKVTIDDTLETTLTLASGAASYTTTFTTAGAHTIVAAYQGDTTHAASTGTVTVTASAVSSNTGTFTLSATAVTVARGSSANSTITVTPKSGYTGTVDLSFDTSNDSALQNLCYEFTNMASSGDGTVAVTSTSAVTTQLSLDTNASDCATSTDVLKSGKRAVRSLHKVVATKSTNTSKTLPASLALAGLLFAGFLGRYARRFRAIAGVILLAAIGFAVSACGGSSSNTVSNPPTGTYTVTVTGQDSATASISAQTTFTFTIQ